MSGQKHAPRSKDSIHRHSRGIHRNPRSADTMRTRKPCVAPFPGALSRVSRRQRSRSMGGLIASPNRCCCPPPFKESIRPQGGGMPLFHLLPFLRAASQIRVPIICCKPHNLSGPIALAFCRPPDRSKRIFRGIKAAPRSRLRDDADTRNRPRRTPATAFKIE